MFFTKSKMILILCICLFAINLYAQNQKTLVILHTNDTHSHIEPLSSNDPEYPDKGGIVRRANFIEQVRKEYSNVLVLQSGDIVQGTPYYNLFHGEAEIRTMNAMGYDAICLGNHEFDRGLEGVADIIKWAKFPVIATNYDFRGTILSGKIKKYCVIKINGLKIGIIGIGINPEGIMSRSNYAGMKYLDPVECASRTATFLKEDEKCDLVICLSHLGYYNKEENRTGDLELASGTRNVDVIIGGHTHLFMKEPVRVRDVDGQEVIISQMGSKGVYMGRMDILFHSKDKTRNN